MTHTTLYVASRTYITERTESQEEYGEWSESWDCQVVYAYLEEPPCTNSMTIDKFLLPEELLPGQTVYVVSMYYSDGDSFGNSSGKMEVLWATGSEQEAKNIQESLTLQTQYTEDSSSNDSLFIPYLDGVIIMGSPLGDYFAHLECINITALEIPGHTNNQSFSNHQKIRKKHK